MAYERIFEGKTKHFILKSEVDLVSDAVWEPGQGQGDRIRAQDQKDSERKKSSMKEAISKVLTLN